MGDIHYAAVAVAVVSAFVASSIYYVALAKQRAALSPAADATRPRPAKMLVEIARNVVLASVIAHLVLGLDVRSWSDAAALSAWLWLGFPIILLSGSVLWEKVPVKLATIHSGDWLIKLLIMTEILALWR